MLIINRDQPYAPPHLLITRCSNEDLIDSEINTYAYIYKIQCTYLRPTCIYIWYIYNIQWSVNLFILDGLNLLADVAYIQQHLPLPSPQPAVASCKRYVYCTTEAHTYIIVQYTCTYQFVKEYQFLDSFV